MVVLVAMGVRKAAEVAAGMVPEAVMVFPLLAAVAVMVAVVVMGYGMAPVLPVAAAADMGCLVMVVTLQVRTLQTEALVALRLVVAAVHGHSIRRFKRLAAQAEMVFVLFSTGNEARTMSKVFQIFGSMCHWNATHIYPNIQSTEGLYAPNIEFVEAPDYVHEGWGYDEAQEGDDRFIEPTPPAGWLYDRTTGTFYEDPNYVSPDPGPDPSDMEEALNILGVQTRETNS